MASFNILKVGAPILAEAGGGAIACVGAAVVHYGIKHHEVWAAAKGAVEGEEGLSGGGWVGWCGKEQWSTVRLQELQALGLALHCCW